MFQVQTLRGRSWAGLAWLGALAIGVLLAVFNIYAGLVLLGLVLVGLVAAVLPARQGAQRRASRLVAGTPAAQRVVHTPDGTEYAAIVVPAEPANDYQLVLTSVGYRLIDSDGRIVYTLKSSS